MLVRGRWTVLAFAMSLIAAGAAAQPPRGGRGGPPMRPSVDSGPDAWRAGLAGDPDPVGAVIERRALLGLTDGQFTALRDLRRWHQRARRAVQDSLATLGGRAGPDRSGAPGGPPGAMGGGAPPDTPAARPLRDSLRAWTRVALDSAVALLTPAQRDTLAAVWLRYRDSLPARGRPRGRP